MMDTIHNLSCRKPNNGKNLVIIYNYDDIYCIGHSGGCQERDGLL